ncbi:MAG: outer membrane lipoprotein chaperone LolA [Pseudomonadales bacterium]|jgi:outer membrane lipoprotein carrier protein|nr:outer membrane lipoprotein chaperone LolA [Pseudomonadales bacterium]
MRKTLAGLCLLLTFSLTSAQELDNGAAALEDLLRQTSSLRAEVNQLLMDQDDREVQETSAILSMRKPANFAWRVIAPYEELTVTDGATIWRYEPDLDQVTVQDFDDQLDRTPVMLLNGDAASIGDAYAVSATQMGGELWRFILTPRRPSSLFERMSLSFDGPVLVEMQFEDSLGQRTSLAFSAVERNLSLPDDTFSFTPPAGAELIDNRNAP